MTEEAEGAAEPFRVRDLAGRVKALSDVVVRLERKLRERTKGLAETLDKPGTQNFLLYASIGFALGILIGILIGKKSR